METNRDAVNQQKLDYIKAQLNELRGNIDAYKANTKTMVTFIKTFNNMKKSPRIWRL